MTIDDRLARIEAIIQTDAGNRGLRKDPQDNLITRTAGDFAAACRAIAALPRPSLGIVTGFYIPTADPPAAETDGPLGAVFLARALAPLQIPVAIIADFYCREALQQGLQASDLVPCPSPVHAPLDTSIRFRTDPEHGIVPILFAPPASGEWRGYLTRDWPRLIAWTGLNQLVALERVGPSHADGRCYSMRGRDISEFTAPVHRFIEDAAQREPRIATVGIGDGGNEIGMGNIPREVIARNIPNGDKVACRVRTDRLIVAGVSNWGAYGLAAGVRLLRKAAHDPALFDPEREHAILRLMVEKGPLVDGVTGRQEATVDGLPWNRHAEVLRGIDAVLRDSA